MGLLCTGENKCVGLLCSEEDRPGRINRENMLWGEEENW